MESNQRFKEVKIMIKFILGLIIGVYLGIGLMYLMVINRGETREE